MGSVVWPIGVTKLKFWRWDLEKNNYTGKVRFDIIKPNFLKMYLYSNQSPFKYCIFKFLYFSGLASSSTSQSSLGSQPSGLPFPHLARRHPPLPQGKTQATKLLRRQFSRTRIRTSTSISSETIIVLARLCHKSYLVVNSKEVKIVKEVKTNDGL